MCFGCPKEPSHGNGSFEYLQHMFWLRNKKNNFLFRTLNWGPVLIMKRHFCPENSEPWSYCSLRSILLSIIYAFKAYKQIREKSTNVVTGWKRTNSPNWQRSWKVVKSRYEPRHVISMSSVDSYEPEQPPFKLWNFKWCSVISLIFIDYSSE